MTDDELLLAATLDQPREETPRLVLADWFDEHDEPDLARDLRAVPQLVAFLAELARWDTVPTMPLMEWRDSVHREAWPPHTAARLLVRYRHLFPKPPGAPESFDPALPTHPSSNDPPDARTFLARWQYERQRQIGELRRWAAMTAGSLRALPRFEFRDAESFESVCCLLHELVARGWPLGGMLNLDELIAAMTERRHPLAGLSLALRPVESAIRFYTLPSQGSPQAGVPLPPRSPSVRPQDLPAVVASEPAPPGSAAFTAVTSWESGSEAAVFRLDRPLDASVGGPEWFTRLPAESVVGAIASPRWRVARLAAADAFGRLYGAASGGGAYSVGGGSGYGRQAAWRSFGWLAGCGEDAAEAAIEMEAVRCEWLEFGGTNWFHDIAWDLGLVCVRPDRRTLALLAATDSD